MFCNNTNIFKIGKDYIIFNDLYFNPKIIAYLIASIMINEKF